MFEVRATRDREEFRRAFFGIGQYFGGPPTDEQIERFEQVLPHERMHAAFDGGAIVGGGGAFPFEMSVPGGVLGCGGVTVGGVYPTPPRRRAARPVVGGQLRR